MSLLEEVRIAEAYERILEREEINEILKLKPEAAKAKATQKLKQMADDIKRAIERHGEDSKTVMYLRAKKKRMQQQLAHAMGEDISEGIKVDKLGPEAKDAFHKISMKKAKKIAVSSMDKTKMYWDVDGTTWLVTMNSMENEGPTKDFLKKVKAGNIKATYFMVNYPGQVWSKSKTKKETKESC